MSIYKQFLVYIAALLGLLCLTTTLADTMIFKIAGTHSLTATWTDGCNGDSMGDMSFSLASNRVNCSDDAFGVECQEFQARDNLQTFYQQVFKVDAGKWPMYTEIKNAGGNKSYQLGSLCSCMH